MPTRNQDNSFAEQMSQHIDKVEISSNALDEAIAWIQKNLEPGDVFDHDQLVAYAEGAGYAKSE